MKEGFAKRYSTPEEVWRTLPVCEKEEEVSIALTKKVSTSYILRNCFMTQFDPLVKLGTAIKRPLGFIVPSFLNLNATFVGEGEAQLDMKAF